MELRIGLIESNDTVRAGRAMVIDSQDDMRVVFEEADPIVALNRVSEYLIDVLVIDSIPRGFELPKYLERLDEQLKSAGSAPAIIVSSTFANLQLRALAIASGATDAVDLESTAEVFLTILRRSSKDDYLASLESLKGARDYVKQSDPLLMESVLSIAEAQPLIVQNFLEGLNDLASSKKLDIAKLRVRQTIDSLIKAGNFKTRNQLAIALMGDGK